MPPEPSSLVILAEQDGEIVGSWCCVDIPHLEGFWIHPDHRKKSRLPVRIVHAMVDELKSHKLVEVLANVESRDAETAGYVQRLGMVQLPIDTYKFVVGG